MRPRYRYLCGNQILTIVWGYFGGEDLYEGGSSVSVL